MLNYGTNGPTRRDLLDASCDAAGRLNDLKRHDERISVRSARAVARRFARAPVLRALLGAVAGDAGASTASRAVVDDVARFSMSPVCGKGELVRPLDVVNFRGAEMARIAARNLARRKRPGQVESVPGGGGPWQKACRVLAAASAAFAPRGAGRLGHTRHARSLREHNERIPGGGDAASARSGRGPARPACEARCSSGSRSTLSRAVSRVAPAGRACGALATATRTRAP